MSAIKLPKGQQELLDAVKSGVIVHYVPYMGSVNPHAYYFRSDNYKNCTAAAKALIKRGLVEIYERSHREHKVRSVTDEKKAQVQP